MQVAIPSRANLEVNQKLWIDVQKLIGENRGQIRYALSLYLSASLYFHGPRAAANLAGPAEGSFSLCVQLGCTQQQV